MLRAEGHEPVALLCVRHDPERYTELGELVRAAPPEADVVMPGSRDRIAPLLRHFDPDLALCLGFPWKIPPDALAVPRHGIVNGHPSLLPRYRGPSPVCVGDPPRRERDRLHLPLHGRRARHGEHPRSAEGPARRRARVGRADAEARDRGRKPPARCPRASRCRRPRRPAGRRRGQLLPPLRARVRVDRHVAIRQTRSSGRFARGASTPESPAIVAPSRTSTARPSVSSA